MAPLAVPETATWLSEQDCVLEDFRALIEQATDLTAFPTAGAVESKILIYEATHLREATEKETGRQAVQAELARALLDGPGVILVRNAFDPSVVDRATTVFATFNQRGDSSREKRRRPLCQAGHKRPPVGLVEQVGRP